MIRDRVLNRPTNKSNSIDSGIPYANPGSKQFRAEVSRVRAKHRFSIGERGLSFNHFANHFRAPNWLETWGRFSTKVWIIRTFDLSIVTSFLENHVHVNS